MTKVKAQFFDRQKNIWRTPGEVLEDTETAERIAEIVGSLPDFVEVDKVEDEQVDQVDKVEEAPKAHKKTVKKEA